MSVEATTAVWRTSRATGCARLVLLALADYANDDFTAWPSVDSLAKKALISERTVRYALRSLEEAGEIATQVASGQHGSNRYVLTVCRRFYTPAEDRTQTPAESAPGAKSAPGKARHTGGQNLPPGGQNTTLRGANLAPNPSENHQITIKEPSVVVVGPRLVTAEAPPPARNNDDDVAIDEAFGAICGVRALDPDELTDKEAAAIEEFARWCASKGVGAETVHTWGGDWYDLKRRQTGKAVLDPPTNKQLREHFAGALAALARDEVRRYEFAGLVER